MASRKTKKWSKNKSKNNNSTFLCVIITDLDLDLQQLKLMSKQVNVSIGEFIHPFNTINDGDIIYTCSI